MPVGNAFAGCGLVLPTAPAYNYRAGGDEAHTHHGRQGVRRATGEPGPRHCEVAEMRPVIVAVVEVLLTAAITPSAMVRRQVLRLSD